MNCQFILVLLVPLLPLLAALGIAVHVLSGRALGDDGEPPTARLAEGAAWLTLLLLLGLGVLALREGAPGHFVVGTWFASGAFSFPISFMLDGLALGFATLVALIGAVTLRFARHYLHREAGFHRFFLLMLLFLAGMLLIVLAGNVVLTFVGWELCGVSSWLLIGYAYERPVATGNALYAFLTNRIGDAGFILGIGLAAWWLGSFEWSAIAAWPGTTGFDKVQARLLLLGFLLAALAKSAQVPLAAWLGRALEGPTPSSAIFYGAVMVHAGVYLVLRFEPLLQQVPDIMVYLALAGALTALYGWLGGLVQSDVKSSLVFATSTQVGLMFLACGLGWFELAAWHMGLHAAWRAWQFLLAPSALELTAEPDRTTAPAPVLAALSRLDAPLFSLALQRFHLDALADATLVQALRAIGSDARRLDENLIAPAAGAPAALPPTLHSEDDEATRERALIGSPGLVGRALFALAEGLQAFEARLLLQLGDTPLTRLLRAAGETLAASERLLEQPRYLLALVALTFVVIL